MLARQHAEHTGLSLPSARRVVTALSIAANKPEPERERTPTLNAASKITAEEDALIRVLAAKGLHAGAIAKRLHRWHSTVVRRARSLGVEIARIKRKSGRH
jgi:DNA-binding NarL/FixJ family response regulator